MPLPNNKKVEKIKWWTYHTRFELIYLLGGIPKEHINTLHYRNVESVVESIKSKIKEANSND